MGYHRKTHAVLLCKSIVISIQWFQMPHIITFSTIYNLAVLFSGARVSQNLSLVPQLVPLHKKGPLDNINNFRGITLLSTLGKLFTRILNNRLTSWTEDFGVYIEAQAGFRAAMGTADNIFVLHGIINHLLNKGENHFCAFVDFTKAFDYVVHDIIWVKLIRLGVRGKILNVIRSMYSHVKSKIKVNNDWF